MRFSFDQAVIFFHERIAFAANRWHGGILDADDVYQELLIAVCSHEFREEKTWCRHRKRWVNYNPTHINTYIDCRAMDLARYQRLRQRVKLVDTEHLDRRVTMPRDIDWQIDLTEQMEQLPDNERQPMMLLLQGQSQKEAARTLGVSAASVSRFSGRARRTLAATLQDQP